MQPTTYNVIERFVSINGEATRCGQLSVFIRFAGCNLRCSYCDSAYAYEEDQYEVMTADQICQYVESTGVRNVTLAGGEPLFQPNMPQLVQRLCKTNSVEIETNGAIDVAAYDSMDPRPILTIDYKTASSAMERFNLTDNYTHLKPCDSLKFVVGYVSELEKAVSVCDQHQLWGKCNILFSPQWGKIEPVEIVQFMKDHSLNDAQVQLQIHKFIWDPDERGV